MLWAKNYGGPNADFIYAIAVDSGSAYILGKFQGSTSSASFGSHPLLSATGNDYDGFVAKIDGANGAMDWATGAHRNARTRDAQMTHRAYSFGYRC